MRYPKITWKRGVITSAVLERAKDDIELVADINDNGAADAHDRYQARWLAVGTQDETPWSTLDAAKAWVRNRVVERMGVTL